MIIILILLIILVLNIKEVTIIFICHPLLSISFILFVGVMLGLSFH